MKISQIPNILTILRLLLVLPVCWLIYNENYDLAFYLFVIAGITDAVDGYLARHFNWISRFGSIVDPLADKFLLVSSFIVLTLMGHIPFWLMFLVLIRDVLILIGVSSLHLLVGRYEFKPSWISKANTFFQILIVLVVLFHLSFFKMPGFILNILIILASVTTVASFIDYTWEWYRRVKVERS